MDSIAGIEKPVSRLVIGSMVVHTDRLPFSFELLDHFYEIGGNAIDTAYVYGGGGSEPAVGQWIRERGLRDQIVLIVKGAATADATPEMVTREMAESLDRLGLEYADLYLMHRDNPAVPVGEFVDCLNGHREAGRISAYGGSNWTTARLQEANDYAARRPASPAWPRPPPTSRWPTGTSRCGAAAWPPWTRTPAPGTRRRRRPCWPGPARPAASSRAASAPTTPSGGRRGARLVQRRQLGAPAPGAGGGATHGVTALQIALAYVLSQPRPRTLRPDRPANARTRRAPRPRRWRRHDSHPDGTCALT